jgi:predicted dehydrogenase
VATKVKVGIIGTGIISKIYIKGLRQFDNLELVACADIDMARARAVAEELHIAKAYTVDELLADPEIQLVINLTIPRAHVAVNLAIIEAGKHVYSEKPFATTLEDAKRVLEAARARGVLIGGAPDTFLGGGQQLCRQLIDAGEIGEPIAAFASMAGYWDGGAPGRDFLFQSGGGPMLDMGPYYITSLVNLLGPIKRVTGSARITFPERIVRQGPHQGRSIAVETPTHITGMLDFSSAAVATMVMSFDIPDGHSLPTMEIYGTEGILSVPDPNLHGGAVRIRRSGAEWTELPHNYSDEYTRGIGVAEMAEAIVSGRQPRANGDLLYHVLETMLAFEQASTSGTHINIDSQPPRPTPLAGE